MLRKPLSRDTDNSDFCGELNGTWNDFLVEFDCVYIWITLGASCFLLCIFLFVFENI